MMKEKDRQEKEAEELKKKRKEEREQKKKERERQKKEKEEERQRKKKEREEKRGKDKEKKQEQGKSKKGKQRASAVQEDLESSGGESTTGEFEQRAIRSLRERRLPARFQLDSSTDSDSEDDTVCGLCNAREPPNCHARTIFWVDCSDCGVWFHTSCALGDNNRLRQYVCTKCV